MTAFSVVLSTLVLRGLTVTPLIQMLKLNRADFTKQELAQPRARLAAAALSALATQTGPEVESVRYPYVIQRAATDSDPSGLQALRTRRELGLAAITIEREELEALRNEDVIAADTYLFLQEERSIGMNSHCFATRSDESRKFDDSEHQRARLTRPISLSLCGFCGKIQPFEATRQFNNPTAEKSDIQR